MPAADSVNAVEDAELVAALRAGDNSAFGLMYDKYADRLFTYAVTLVKDRDAAADVVHDAFLVAHGRIDQLRDPTRLRSWLYAIARSEGLRALRGSRRSTPLDAAGDVMDHSIDLDADLNAADARTLVAAALAGLGSSDREVIELSLRHELDTGEVASSLGVSSSHASALVSRAKAQFEKAMTAVVLMRTKGRACSVLATLIADEGELTPLVRKRVVRHAADCENCERERRTAVAALPGLALAAPLLAAPSSVRQALVDTVQPSSTTGSASDVVARSGRFDADGFPVTAMAKRRRGLLAVAAAVGLVLFIGAGAVAIATNNDVDATSAVTVTSATSTTTPNASPSAAPRASASASKPEVAPAPNGAADAPAAAGGQSIAPAPTPVDRRPATVAFSFSDLDEGTCPATFTGRVSASATGPTIASVTAIWLPINGGSGSGEAVPLSRTGTTTWRGDVPGVPTQQENVLRIRAVTSSGVVTLTPTTAFEHICPG